MSCKIATFEKSKKIIMAKTTKKAAPKKSAPKKVTAVAPKAKSKVQELAEKIIDVAEADINVSDYRTQHVRRLANQIIRAVR